MIGQPRSSINISEVLINEQSNVYSSEEQKYIDKIELLEHKNISVQSVDVFGNLKEFREDVPTDSAKVDILLSRPKDVTEVVPSNALRDFTVEQSIEQFVTPDLVTAKSVNKDENVFLASESDLAPDRPVESSSAQKELHLEDTSVSVHQTTLAETEDRPVEREQPRKKKLRVNIKPRQSVKVRQVLPSEKELRLKESKVKDDKASQDILERASVNVYTSKLLESESVKTEDKISTDTASKTQDHLQAIQVRQVTSSQDVEQLEISAANIQTISLGLTEKKVISRGEGTILEKEEQLKIDELDKRTAETSIDQDKALSVQFKEVFERTEDFDEFRPEGYSANLNLSQPTFKNLVVSDIQTSENVQGFRGKTAPSDQAIEKELFRKNLNLDVSSALILETEQKLDSESIKESSAKPDLTFISVPLSFQQGLLENKQDFEVEAKSPSHVKSELLISESSNVTEVVSSQKEGHFSSFQPEGDEAEQSLVFTKSINIKSPLPLQGLTPFDSVKAVSSSATSDLELNKNILLVKDTKSSENEIKFEIYKPKKVKKLPKFMTKEAIVVKQIDTGDLEDRFSPDKVDEKSASQLLLPHESIQVKDSSVNERESSFDRKQVCTSTLDNRTIEKHTAVQVQQTLTQSKEIGFEVLQRPEENASVDLVDQRASSVKSDSLLEKERDFVTEKVKPDSAKKNLTFKKAFQTSQTTDLVKESTFTEKVKKKKTKPKLDDSALISCDVKTVVTVEDSGLFKTKKSKPDTAKLNILESEALQIAYTDQNDKESLVPADQTQPSSAKLNKELIKRRPVSVERKQTYLKESILKPDEIKSQVASEELVCSDVNVIDIQNAVEKEGMLFGTAVEDRILRIIIKEKEYHEKIIREQPHAYMRKEDGEEILIEESTVVMVDQPEIVEEVQKKIKIKPKAKPKIAPIEEHSIEDSLQDTSRDIEEEFISIEQLPESEMSETVSLKKKKPSVKSVSLKLPDVSEAKTCDVHPEAPRKASIKSVSAETPLVTEEGLIKLGDEQDESEIESIKLKSSKKKSIVEESITLDQPTSVTLEQEQILTEDRVQEDLSQEVRLVYY